MMQQSEQRTANSERHMPALLSRLSLLASRYSTGFTLIETLVAISLLALAIVAPMSLTTQSLTSAYYARDQMTAFHLAQEAIESVRAARDENILQGEADLLAGIPTAPEGSPPPPFVIDTRNSDPVTRMIVCDQGIPAVCPNLRVPTSPTDPAFYAYGPIGTTNIYTSQVGWESTRFQRTITAEMIPGSNNDEMKVTVSVSWRSGPFQPRTITMRENLYRWIDVGGSVVTTQCSDSIDNDGDTLVDLGDPGCVDASDDDETNGGG